VHLLDALLAQPGGVRDGGTVVVDRADGETCLVLTAR